MQKTNIAQDSPMKCMSNNNIAIDATAQKRNEKLKCSVVACAAPITQLVKSNSEDKNEKCESHAFATFLAKLVYDEVVPAFEIPYSEWCFFAKEIDDEILLQINTQKPKSGIALLEEWGKKALPTMKKYLWRYKKLPKRIVFSLAVCCVIQDCVNEIPEILKDTILWGESLVQIAGLASEVQIFAKDILNNGIETVMKKL